MQATLTRVGGMTADMKRVGGMSCSLSRVGGMTCQLSLVCSVGTERMTVITFNHVAIVNNGVIVGYKYEDTI